MIRQDDTGKPDKAISAIEQLATGDEVTAIVGPYTSACANAVAKQAEQYGVSQVIPAASKEDITRQGYKWVFRVNAPAHVYAKSLIDAALGLRQAQDRGLHLRVDRLRLLALQGGQGVRHQQGAQGGGRRGLPEGLARLPLHPHQGEGAEPRPGLHGLLRGRRHPADAPVARARPEAAGLPGRRRRLRHRAVRGREGHLHQRLLGDAVDARLQPRPRRSSRPATRPGSASAPPTTPPAPTPR